MTVEELITGFLNEWPDAEFGPGHIVLGDMNLADGHIQWCLGLCRAALSGDANDLLDRERDLELMEQVNWYRRQDREELRQTEAFLVKLLAIPEAEREGEEDAGGKPAEHLDRTIKSVRGSRDCRCGA